MAKRKVTFDLPEDEDDAGEGPSEDKRKKKMHSLDSDEEDEESKDVEKYNFLDPEEFFGEEAGIARQEGEVKITPFNMNEELEEGHFDKEGTYIFHKQDEVRDYFVDNIDKFEMATVKKKDEEDEDSSDEEPPAIDVRKCFKEMLALMNPNETVTRAIQRLGKSSKKPAGKRNAAKEGNSNETQRLNSTKDKENLMELIALADKVLQTGDMDVYEKTYEQIKFYISTAEEDDDDMFRE